MVWFWVLTFVCLGILIWLIRKPAQTNAIEMLNMRYAKGELTREQFERMKRELSCASDGS